jgi:hypothetical protein
MQCPLGLNGSEGIFLFMFFPVGFRLPARSSGVQINFCKNLECSAFRVPETLGRIRGPKWVIPQLGDYKLVGQLTHTLMKCGVYGSVNPIPINEAIYKVFTCLSVLIFDQYRSARVVSLQRLQTRKPGTRA